MDFSLTLPPRYRAADMLAYHGRDPASASERVRDGVIAKPIRIGGAPALVEIDLRGGAALCRLDRAASEPERAEVERMLVRMLGLVGDPEAFEALPGAARIIGMRAGLRIPLTATVWEAVCWAVIGQQINLTFAAALRRAMIERAGEIHAPSGLRVHPGPSEVAALDPAELAALRFSRSKASYLVGVAQSVVAGELALDGLAELPQDEAEARLTALRGIGPWTARYILLRGVGAPDIAPVGDSGLATALQWLHALPARPDIRAQEEAMMAYAPHRSLATAHLWASLAKVE